MHFNADKETLRLIEEFKRFSKSKRKCKATNCRNCPYRYRNRKGLVV